MNIVTMNLVEYVLTNYIADDLTVTYEVIGYLRELLSPYTEAMMLAETPESLLDWMNQLFNEDILRQINAELDKFPRDRVTV